MNAVIRNLWLAPFALLAACAAQPDPTPSQSAWGEIVTVAKAQQSNAPVLWLDGGEITAAWVGADDAGVHQDARRVTAAGLEPVVVLPLPPDHPYEQQSAFAAGSSLHLLWLDADGDSNRLFSALLAPDLSVRRGPTLISDRLTLRYALVTGDDGSLWAAWSGGLLSEPSIYVQPIDGDGRPREARLAAADADFPALARTDGGDIFLFWLGNSDGQLYRARLAGGVAQATTRLTTGVRLNPGDRLTSLSAGLDSAYAYVFWNITRLDGSAETWLASGELAAVSWNQPQPLTAGAPVRRAAPLQQQHDPLLAAVETDGGLGIAYLRFGEVVEDELVAPGVRLPGLPGLYADDAMRLTLAWAAPMADGYAAMNLTRQR